MKFTRFLHGSAKSKKKKIKWGILKGDTIEVISGSPFSEWKRTGVEIKDYDVQFLSPCNPSKIVCIGLNYQEHIDELEMEAPDEPLLFMKPSSSILGPEEYIVKPSICQKLDYEAELAAIIGKEARKISPEEVKHHVLGYTCFNDVTARDIQRKDGQWTRAKSFDTFAPVGPVMKTDIDPNNLKIELILNDKVMQSSSTSNMIFKMEELISFVSSVMTLYPQDIIATGTPPRVGGMGIGDVVEVVIEEIGVLRNYVTEEE